MNKQAYTAASFFLFLIFLLFSPTKILAQTLPTIGANLNSYTPPAKHECNIKVPVHYPTIQAGINAANSGDTVCVDSGTYNEGVEIKKTISLLGQGAGSTTISGNNTLGGSTVIFDSPENNILMAGFRIIGTGTAPTNSTIIVAGVSTGVHLKNNHIISGNSGIALNIYGNRNDDIIENNVIEGRDSSTLMVVSHDYAPENEQIINNTFTGTVLESSVRDSGVALAFGAKNSIVRHNAFNTGGSVRVILGVDFASNNINENNFNSPTNFKLGSSERTSILNAENNWWGDADPSDNIGNISFVDYDPFSYVPFPEYPLDTPSDSIEDIINTVQFLDLNKGISKNFEAKLNTANKLNSDSNIHNNDGVVNLLQALIKVTNAQSGKKLTDTEANIITAQTESFIDYLNY